MVVDMPMVQPKHSFIKDANLNEAQEQAILSTHGPVLVLAGAGSGKTRVLTHKIAHLIQAGVDPHAILAVTFTNKAAKEMNHRIESLLGVNATRHGLWIGTFHSLCGRLLRREISAFQSETGRAWNSNFVIYDESDSLAAVREAIKALELDDKLYNPKSIRYQISNLKNQLMSAYQYASNAVDYKSEKLARIYDTYEAILFRNNALDFDDLLKKAVEVLRALPEVRQKYHRQFTHVLVDEFQDTNDAQYEFVRLIVEGETQADRKQADFAHLWDNRGLTVVGDVDQSIYSWRGANFRILLNFQKDFPAAQIIKLEHNYRSTANILQLANHIIENNDERMEKTLIAVKGSGDKIACYEAQDDRDEAFHIIQQFQAKIDKGSVTAGQCCILYRTNAQSRVFEDVLMSKGLPYSIVGGIKFYERREIRDMLAYLTVLFNPQDGYSVKRILNVPKRGIGKTSMEKIEAYAAQNSCSFFEALRQPDQIEGLGPKAQKAIGGFLAVMNTFWEHLEGLSLPELMVYVAEESGYLQELKQEDPLDAEGRIQNIEELVSVAKQYILDNPDGDLGGFLTQMSLLSDLDSAESAENRFVLMTMHAAKGLEFDAVAIAGLEEGVFPHARSLSDRTQMEEERRLMYVSVTRAREHLLLTYARRRMIFGEVRYGTPSRFLQEAPQELFSGLYTLDKQATRSDYSPTRNYRSPQPERERGYTSSIFEDDSPSVSRIKPKAKPAPTLSTPPVKLLDTGTRVRHAKFGLGTIQQLIGDGDKAIYGVKFDTIPGQKLLDPKFANLDVV